MSGPSARRAVLVTGGTGFVGGAVIAALAAANYRVRVLSRRHPLAGATGVEYVRGDLGSRESLQAALAGCEAVIHCAGEKSDIARMQEVNVDGTRRLFEVSGQLGVQRFCHLSSVGVIGRVTVREVDESTPCRPMSRYEETKLRAEQCVAQGLDGGNVVILRPTNVFGAATLDGLARHSPAAKLKLALKAREHAHFVYVGDVAAAALHLTFRAAAPAIETCIVSSDEEPGNTVAEIQAVVAAARDGAPRTSLALPAFVPYYLRRLGGGAANRGDVVYSAGRLRATGFRFPFGLASGLRQALIG